MTAINYILNISAPLCLSSIMNSRRKDISISPPPALRRRVVEEDSGTSLRAARVQVTSPTKPAARRTRVRTDITRRSRTRTGSANHAASIPPTLPAQIPPPTVVDPTHVEKDTLPLEMVPVMEESWGGGSDVGPDMDVDEDITSTPEGIVVSSFEQYVDAVLMLMVGFIHLSHSLFAVQGWSKDRAEGQV